MPVRISKKSKQLIVSQNLEKILMYPFVNNFNVLADIADIDISNNIYGDRCGYLTFQNINELDGKIICQQTVKQGTVAVRFRAVIYDNPIVPTSILPQEITIINEIDYRTQLNSYQPLEFDLTKVKCQNTYENNRVILFIFAYNIGVPAPSENLIDLVYFKSNVAI